MEETGRGDITVSMSMYGGNEQFCSLGRYYPADDRRITTQSGDIVLFSGNQIVLFYGPNTWEYTMFGKMKLSKQEVTDLPSNGNVILKIRDEKE